MFNSTAKRTRNGSARGAHDDTTKRLVNAVHSVQETVDRVAEQAGSVAYDLRDRAAALKEQALEQEQRAQAAVKANLRKTRTYIRKQPLRGAGIAFAAGVVVSALLLRR